MAYPKLTCLLWLLLGWTQYVVDEEGRGLVAAGGGGGVSVVVGLALDVGSGGLQAVLVRRRGFEFALVVVLLVRGLRVAATAAATAATVTAVVLDIAVGCVSVFVVRWWLDVLWAADTAADWRVSRRFTRHCLQCLFVCVCVLCAVQIDFYYDAFKFLIFESFSDCTSFESSCCFWYYNEFL